MQLTISVALRYHTHLLTGRKVEHISLELQPALAAESRYVSDSRLLASEKSCAITTAARRNLSIRRICIRRTSERKRVLHGWFGRTRAVFLGEPFAIKDESYNWKVTRSFCEEPFAHV